VSPNGGACATRGHSIVMHPPFWLSPPKGGSRRDLPVVVERQGHHVARNAFDERTVARQGSQIIYSGVDIHEAVARQSPRGAKAEYAGVPKNWAHIVFHECPIGSGFTAGRPSPTAALTLLIRTGRSADYKREMLKRLWSLVQTATGAPDEEIVLGIQEVPSSQAMEMGQIMPDVANS
jgi:hypothetical protein